MNDFFNVLDDFALEEFALMPESGSGSGDTLTVDVGDDSSRSTAIEDIKEDASEVTEDEQTVWEDGNPFSGDGSTSGVVVNYDTTYHESGGGSTGEYSYYSTSLTKVNSLFFTTATSINVDDTNLTLATSVARTIFNLVKGIVTGGVFGGNGRFSISKTNAADGDSVTIDIDGFTAPTNDDERNSEAFGWTSDGTDLKSINTTQDYGGSVTVTGDVDFSVDGHAIKLTGASAEDSSITFSYGEDDGAISLDLSGVVEDSDSSTILTVKKTGDAVTILPPDASTEIKIGTITYDYSLGTNSGAYFTLEDGAVTGFVLDVAGDSITVDNKSQSLVISDSDEPGTSIIDVSGTGYTVTKTSTSYTVAITESATVKIGDSNFEFTVSKATDLSNNPIVITFDEDGNVENVAGLERLTSEKDSLVYSGPEAESADDGLVVNGTQTIAVSNGQFVLTGGAEGEQKLAIVTGEQLFGVYTDMEVVTTDGLGTVVDVDGVPYTYGGNGYFTATADGNVTGFVFVSASDYVILPTSDAIDVVYGDVTVDVPDVSGDDYIRVVLNDATKSIFQLDNLAEDAVVVGDNMTVTASDDTTEVLFNADGDIIGVNNYNGDLTIEEGEATDGFIFDGTTFTTTSKVTVTGASNKATTVKGLVDGGEITVEDGDDVEIVFEGDGSTSTTETYTVNGLSYYVSGDADGVTITPDGKVTGLDADASLTLSEAKDVTVNGDTYTAEQDPVNNPIVGYAAKDTSKGVKTYIEDEAHPLFNNLQTTDYIEGKLFGTDNMIPEAQTFYETDDGFTGDHSNDALRAKVVLNGEDDTTVKFNNNLGKNLAIVDGDATGDKTIELGNKGDAVIMDGTDEYSTVNIALGAGHDTVVVRGDTNKDSVVKGATKTVIDFAGTTADSADRIITYAAANANIILNNYDETGKGGVVLHDPELPNIKDLGDAIEDGLLTFEDGSVVAIDRGETTSGYDRKTTIQVNNKNAAHQSMVRLFGYKDNQDVYSDDYGQLVGFTDKSGGILNASDIAEEVVLVGNYYGNHSVGSALTGTVYNDTIYGGAGDTLDAGKGANTINLQADTTRDAATVVIGGGNDTITGLNSGFNGDVLYGDLASGDLDVTFDGTNLTISSEKDKFSAVAASVASSADYVNQLFVSGDQTLKAAIAVDGGTVSVTGNADTETPNYFGVNNGGIDFSSYTGDVQIDMDNDWVTSNINGDTVLVAGAVNSLIGGSGNTLFKGSEYSEILVAGTGESSLYGAGGKNLLVGQADNDDKFGSTEFFVQGINNGAQNTITGFEFIDSDGGSNTATFDNLNLGMSDGNDVTDIQVSGNNVTLAIKGDESGHTEKVTIEGAAGKEMLVDRGTNSETVAQIASSINTISHDYVDFYSATEKNATVQIGDVTSAKVWLEAPDYSDGVEFVGDYTVIDARGSNAEVEMAGNNVANTIYGGAGNASMWGGTGNANDVMYGGTAHNEFYYEVGNGNDTIFSSTTGDIIHLGMSIDQIDFDNTNFTTSGLEVTFSDGGKLAINNTNDVTFSFDDGTEIKANQTSKQFE